MYHSITFTNSEGITKNTWDDWHLIPTSRPVFNPPSVKTKYLELPGSSRIIDFSEAVKKYPLYGSREGSLEFMVENGHSEWYELYYEILRFLNGKRMQVSSEDDISYYYEGRFSVNEWKSDKHYSIIAIDYKLAPYKLRIHKSTDDWLWDPFNFENGIIQTDFFSDIIVNSENFSDENDFGIFGLIGRKPVCPTFIVSDSALGITVKFENEELDISRETTFQNGSSVDSKIIMSNVSGCNDITMRFKGVGKISIDFRSGGL